MVTLKITQYSKANVVATAETSMSHPPSIKMDDLVLMSSPSVPTPQYLNPLRVNQGAFQSFPTSQPFPLPYQGESLN